jgi:PadR family transcriptional regulator PadR
MPDPTLDVLRGTLDLLILKAVAAGPLHGYAVAKWVKAASRETLDVEDRALYLALHRLEARKSIRGRWTTSPTGRRAKQYELTAAGRKRLATDRAQWERYVRAMGYVLTSKLAERV